jgi:hypothetical protein
MSEATTSAPVAPVATSTTVQIPSGADSSADPFDQAVAAFNAPRVKSVEAKPEPRAEEKPKAKAKEKAPEPEASAEDEVSDEAEEIEASASEDEAEDESSTKAKAKDKEKEQIHKFKADGKDYALTTEQLIKHAQQGIGAQKAWKQLKEVREDVSKILAGGKEAFETGRIEDLAKFFDAKFDTEQFALTIIAELELKNNQKLTPEERKQIQDLIGEKRTAKQEADARAAAETAKRQRAFGVCDQVATKAMENIGLKKNSVVANLVSNELKAYVAAGIDPQVESVMSGTFDKVREAFLELTTKAADSDEDALEIVGEDLGMRIARAVARKMKGGGKKSTPVKSSPEALQAAKKRPSAAPQSEAMQKLHDILF